MKLAFIIQRYGTEVLGGSEHLCRLMAERLAAQHEIDVLTTCARDYVTWANEYPEGADRIRGVTVRRFANARARDIGAFNTYSDWIYNHAHTAADEMEWLKQQGPWSPALLEYLRRHHQQYRRPGILHLSLRPDRARPRGRPGAKRPDPDCARRTRHPARPLQGPLQPAGCPLLSHRERASIRRASVPRAAAAGGSDRGRRRHSTTAAVPADAAGSRERGAGHRRRRRTGGRRVSAAPARAGRGLPPPAPVAWSDCPLRRPDRSRQGLRGADRGTSAATSRRAATPRSR